MTYARNKSMKRAKRDLERARRLVVIAEHRAARAQCARLLLQLDLARRQLAEARVKRQYLGELRERHARALQAYRTAKERARAALAEYRIVKRDISNTEALARQRSAVLAMAKAQRAKTTPPPPPAETESGAQRIIFVVPKRK